MSGVGRPCQRWPPPYSQPEASTTATTWTRATPVREVVSMRPSRPAATTARAMANVGRTHELGVNSVVSGQLTTRVAGPARAVSGHRVRLMAPPPGSWRPHRARGACEGSPHRGDAVLRTDRDNTPAGA